MQAKNDTKKANGAELVLAKGFQLFFLILFNFSYKSVKVVLLANDNKYEVDSSTFFPEW
jgi:hypothetical protein